jgi:IS1 family transposase
MNLYHQVKAQRKQIEAISTDANSCDAVAFSRHQGPELHRMTKAQTHLIESFNSSIRDNLARFNRRTKRFSKSWEMLKITLDLFFHYKREQSACRAGLVFDGAI